MINAQKHIYKPVILYGVEYPSLNEGARQIKMNSGTLYRKILSSKYPEFKYKN